MGTKNETTQIKFYLKDWKEELRKCTGDAEKTEKVVITILVTTIKALLKGRGETMKLPALVTRREKQIHDNAIVMLTTIFQQRIIDLAKVLNIATVNLSSNENETNEKRKIEIPN